MELELTKFIKDLKIIEVAAYQVLKNNAFIFDKRALKSLNRFHENVILFKTQRSTDLNGLTDFVIQNGVESLIADLLLIINTNDTTPRSLTRGEASMLENLAKHMMRLKAIAKISLKDFINIHKDDEVFKPKDIDLKEITHYLDNALIILSENNTIKISIKESLIHYITETQTELKKVSPSWKKIVGGIVIVAAILSGIADAPTALENIKNAYSSIMGTPFSHPIEEEIIDRIEFIQLNPKIETDTPTV